MCPDPSLLLQPKSSAFHPGESESFRWHTMGFSPPVPGLFPITQMCEGKKTHVPRLKHWTPFGSQTPRDAKTRIDTKWTTSVQLTVGANLDRRVLWQVVDSVIGWEIWCQSCGKSLNKLIYWYTHNYYFIISSISMCKMCKWSSTFWKPSILRPVDIIQSKDLSGVPLYSVEFTLNVTKEHVWEGHHQIFPNDCLHLPILPIQHDHEECIDLILARNEASQHLL